MATLYIVDPGIMRDALVHSTLQAGRAARDDAGSGARFYRSARKGSLEEWKFGEWCEVDPISGSAPVKVWQIVKVRKVGA